MNKIHWLYRRGVLELVIQFKDTFLLMTLVGMTYAILTFPCYIPLLNTDGFFT